MIGDKRTISSKAMDCPSKKGKQSSSTPRESAEGDLSEKPSEQFTKRELCSIEMRAVQRLATTDWAGFNNR